MRSHGSIVAIGLPANAYLKAPVFNTVVRMINIKGSYVGNRQDSVEAIEFFARGLIHAPFKTVPLKELPQVFELMGLFFLFFFLNLFSLLFQRDDKEEYTNNKHKQNKAKSQAATFSTCRSNQSINQHTIAYLLKTLSIKVIAKDINIKIINDKKQR